MVSLQYQTEWDVELNDIPNSTADSIINLSVLFDESRICDPSLIGYVEMRTVDSQ